MASIGTGTTHLSRRAASESDPQVMVHDSAARPDSFRDDALRGLSRRPKAINSKYFYDEHGSRLFDRICELDDYYLTRVELRIMRDHVGEMAAELGERCCLIEYGSGSGLKTSVLLRHMARPAAYVPVEISLEHLTDAAQRMRVDFPDLPILPVCADFMQHFDLPEAVRGAARRAVYFPGSTIGNFEPSAARRLLAGMAETCGAGGGVLIGVDLKKDRATLERAYNDSEGVTAEFNLNLLTRMNRELGADFDLTLWRHQSLFNESEGRIETHLVSTAAQTVHIAQVEFRFDENDTIHTENSYKYDLGEFALLARTAGLSTRRTWSDAEGLFSVQYLVVD